MSGVMVEGVWNRLARVAASFVACVGLNGCSWTEVGVHAEPAESRPGIAGDHDEQNAMRRFRTLVVKRLPATGNGVGGKMCVDPMAVRECGNVLDSPMTEKQIKLFMGAIAWQVPKDTRQIRVGNQGSGLAGRTMTGVPYVLMIGDKMCMGLFPGLGVLDAKASIIQGLQEISKDERAKPFLPKVKEVEARVAGMSDQDAWLLMMTNDTAKALSDSKVGGGELALSAICAEHRWSYGRYGLARYSCGNNMGYVFGMDKKDQFIIVFNSKKRCVGMIDNSYRSGDYLTQALQLAASMSVWADELSAETVPGAP